VDMTWWVRVSDALTEVASLQAGTPFAEAYPKISLAISLVLANYADNALMKLIVSLPGAITFFGYANKIVNNLNRTEPLTVEEVGELRKSISEYRPILNAEVQAADTYYIQQQGAFSTRTLIENADRAIALSTELIALLSEDVKSDLRESGRCLAFQLPTASGFHVARATETIIKTLMRSAKCEEPKESQRNWGIYIKLLEEKQVDRRITHHLAQIKDLHRNPLSHPDVTLTMPEALALWSVCTSLIGTMIAEIARLTPISA